MTDDTQIEVSVNGIARDVRAGCTVAALIVELQLRPQFIAVEINRDLVRRSTFETTEIQAGDAIEIVTLVGGG